MADDNNIDLQMENDLKALFGSQTSAPPATGAAPAPAGTQQTAPPPAAAAETDASDVSDDQTSDTSDASDVSDVQELTDKEKQLKALAELDGEEKPNDQQTQQQQPALNQDQQIILQNIPDRQTAERLVSIANNHVAFEQTLLNGEFTEVEDMFKKFNPQAYDKLVEGIYQKYGRQFTERYVDENDPERQNDPNSARVRKLEKELEDIKKRDVQRSNEQQVNVQRAEQQRIFNAYSSHLDNLFTRVGITDETDKKFIRNAINAEVRDNKKVASEIASGNMRGLTEVFKTNANAYLERDKQFNTKTTAKIKEQERKVPPAGGGGGTVTNAGDDLGSKNWKDVPKGREDEALTSKLTNFFAGLKSKKR